MLRAAAHFEAIDDFEARLIDDRNRIPSQIGDVNPFKIMRHNG